MKSKIKRFVLGVVDTFILALCLTGIVLLFCTLWYMNFNHGLSR